MKLLFPELRTAVIATLVLCLVCCGLYPLIVYGLGQMLFPHQANGSLIVGGDGAVRGAKLIGQNFSGARYFHPRSSAAGAHGYDATSSGGSNLGPTSQKLIDQVRMRVAAYRAANGLATEVLVPADAVTASGSGLDPHISVKNARLQAPRVARERGLALEAVSELLEKHTARPQLGFLGDAGVNVLTLNLALDAATAGQ